MTPKQREDSSGARAVRFRDGSVLCQDCFDGRARKEFSIKGSLLPIIFVTIGGVIYHVAQKSVERTASPLAVVIYAYATGILLCLVAGMFDSAWETGWLSPGQIDGAVLGVGFGAVLIEVGFLLTYRSGWNLSSTSVVSNIATALVLLPVGLIFFREPLSLRKLVGIAFCLTGIVLLARR